MHAPDRGRVTVSAVMPTYNHSAFLQQAIDSILGQTFQDWELIIVDDGSTDDTARVLRACTDPRIIVHTLPVNCGRARARNAALARARGRYVAICDSDDVSAATRFERQVSFLDSHSDVAVVSTYIRAFSGAANVLMAFPPDHVSIARRFARGKMGVAHGASMIRVECFERLGTYCEDLRSAEDFELLRRFAGQYRFQTLPDALLDYRHDVGTARMSAWAESGRAHRYALYRSSCRGGGGAVLSLDEFSRRWQTRLAVYTVDLLRAVHFNLKARMLSNYVSRAADSVRGERTGRSAAPDARRTD
jgi:glycosyltransferase involved in cell wall biosynthesis